MKDFFGTRASFLDWQPHEPKMGNSEQGTRLKEAARSGRAPGEELTGNEE